MTGVDVSQVIIGEVTSLDDKQKLGRVKVKYPYLDGVESGWCPVVSPMAGPGRGFVCCPEVGDQVLLALEFGDPNRAYVLGAVWSEKQKPPPGDGRPVENNLRFLRSRSGHLIQLDDTKGKERIEFIDKDESRKVVIDSAGKKIQIICDSGDVDIEAGSGNVTVTATTGSVTVDAQSLTLKASQQITIEAKGQLTLKGATVNIN
jgi:phage baseplate assembly protein V